jgi:hypothetical protein
LRGAANRHSLRLSIGGQGGAVMVVKRNEDGIHSVTILVPPDRTQREDYIKLPLVRPRNRIVAFFADLFRGSPNPFLASPIAAAIDRNIKVEKQARALPQGDGEAADALLTRVEASLDRYLRGSADKADSKLDRIDRQTDEEGHFLEACRPSAMRLALDGELDKIANDVNSELGPAATTLARRQIALDNFVHDNQVERTIWWGRPLTRQSIYLIVGITIFEFLLNTAFFSGSQRSGIIGGFGIAHQFSHPRAEGRGWYGRIGILLLALATLFYLLLLTLARLAGELGDTHMFATAADQILVRPFAGLLDLPALAYFFFSIAVIAGIFFKFIDTMGHYPRIRSHRLAVDKAEHDYEAIRFGLIEAARTRADEAIKALDAAPGIIQATLRAIKDLVMNFENVADQFVNDVKDIKDACRLLVGVVRQHAGVPLRQVEIDYDGELAKMNERLQAFRARAARLHGWEEVSAAQIDRCRTDMSRLGKEKIAEIEAKCDSVRDEAYEAIRAVGATSVSGRRLDNLAVLQTGTGG